MAKRPHKNDISIGQDRWIKFGDLDGGQARAIEIDPHLTPLMPFLETLETHCEAECCGIDAFGLWPEHIEKAATALDQRQLERLATDLAAVQSEIESLPGDTVVSKRMNQYFRKVVFLEILAHVHRVIQGMAQGIPGAKT